MRRYCIEGCGRETSAKSSMGSKGIFSTIAGVNECRLPDITINW